MQQISEALLRYKQEPDFKLGIRTLLALAYVPVEKVLDAYDKLVDSNFFSSNDYLQPLLDYMEDVWIGRMTRNGRRQPRFKIE